MADAAQPEPVKNLRGTVTRGDYAKGSKSERVAVFLETTEGRFLLRRKNGPAFADMKLERYVGHTVACDGFLVGTTVLAVHISIEG
jgi:hypothetical protein